MTSDKISSINKKELLTLKNIIRFVGLIVVFFLIYSLLNWIGNYLQQEHIRNLILEAESVGFLIYGIYYLFSVIIAPFPIIAILTVVTSIYGAGKIVLFSYFLALIGATVNFYIARFLGRPVMKRLIGKRGLKKVDKYTDNFGIEALILFRLFGALMFEYISFAAGLSNISFKTYIIITAVASIPYHILLYIVVSSLESPGNAFIAFSLFVYVGFTIPIIYFILKSHVLEKILKREK